MYVLVKVFMVFVWSQWMHQNPVGASKVQEGLGRVIGGTNATANEFPFLIALEIDDKVRCGGSLINAKYVLSAAHCFNKYKPRHVFAIAGAHILSEKSKHEQRRSIKWIYSHRQFNKTTYEHDIALLELTHQFRITETVKPIALADYYYVPNGYVTVVGWGTTDAKSHKNSDILQKLILPIANHTNCEENYSKITNENGEPNPGKVTSKQICAGFKKGGKDACSGDSGGPLIATIRNVPTLVGITSFGADCALAGYPGIYTDITKYGGWITTFMH